MKMDIFSVTYDGKKKPSQFLKAGNYDHVNGLVTKLLSSRYPIGKNTKGRCNVVILNPGHRITSQLILAAAKKEKLARPMVLDALAFGAEYPTEQLKTKIIFLLDPPFYWSGHDFHLVLQAEEGKRKITLISPGGAWEEGCRFAFIAAD